MNALTLRLAIAATGFALAWAAIAAVGVYEKNSDSLENAAYKVGQIASINGSACVALSGPERVQRCIAVEACQDVEKLAGVSEILDRHKAVIREQAIPRPVLSVKSCELVSQRSRSRAYFPGVRSVD